MSQTGQMKDIEKVLRECFTRDSIPVSSQGQENELQVKAWESFTRQKLPNRKMNDWKRVDLAEIPWQKQDASIRSGDTKPSSWHVLDAEVLAGQGVFGGCFKDALIEFPDRVAKVIDPDRDIFAAMAMAFASDGVFIRIPSGVKLKDPIRIRANDDQAHMRLFNHVIWLERGAEAQIILEDCQALKAGTDPSVSNGNIGILLDEQTILKFVEITTGTNQTWTISHEKAVLNTDSQLEWLIYALDGRFSKHFIQSDLIGQGGVVKMAGLYLPSGKQQVEFNTRQNHLTANTKSDLLYKGVLLDDSQSLFSGMIHVAPGAFKTDGYQANRNLIIGANARADTLPGLEILTDDVRCTHGATVGKIDPTEQFYLQSRGLDPKDAQKLIIQGFLDPIVQLLPDEKHRSRLQDTIDHKLSERG